MEPAKNYVLKAHINLAALQGTLQRSLQHVQDVVSFGLIASQNASEQTLQLPGAFFHMMPASNETLDFETARNEFNKWVLMAGMRDCVEGVNVFLDRCRRVCFLQSMADKPEIPAEEWNKGMVEESIRFHRKGLPDKIKHMQNKYGDSILPEVTKDVLSINLARNCLVHREGVVTQHDLNSEEGLLVKWRKMEVVVSGPSGERLIAGEARVEAGEQVSLRHAKAQRLFKKGEVVAFTVDEFAELSLTLTLFGFQIANNIEDYGRSHGVSFDSPKKTLPE
jgi:hypothetical protein